MASAANVLALRELSDDSAISARSVPMAIILPSLQVRHASGTGRDTDDDGLGGVGGGKVNGPTRPQHDSKAHKKHHDHQRRDVESFFTEEWQARSQPGGGSPGGDIVHDTTGGNGDGVFDAPGPRKRPQGSKGSQHKKHGRHRRDLEADSAPFFLLSLS
ncbi:hypothetical protein OC844_007404 [Tilletia horrida]|nr:hypothetical protein OC844_007404 [Tilletia horrida]